MPSTFTLGDKYEELLDELVSSGDYGNKSEAVRAALRLLQRERIQWADILKEHRAALSDPQPLVSRDEAFKRLRGKYTTVGKSVPDEDAKVQRGRPRKS